MRTAIAVMAAGAVSFGQSVENFVTRLFQQRLSGDRGSMEEADLGRCD